MQYSQHWLMIALVDPHIPGFSVHANSGYKGFSSEVPPTDFAGCKCNIIIAVS